MSKRFLLVLALLAAVPAAGFLVIDRLPGARAEDEPHIVFLNITGEGPTAKAWYRGAPPAGVAVQDALDKFSSEGYHVANVSPSQRPIITTIASGSGSVTDRSEVEQFFIVLLERP
jgi:hypothetical protein